MIDNSVVLSRDKFLSAKVEAAVLIEAWLLSDYVIRQVVSRNHCHLGYVHVTIGIVTRRENADKISRLRLIVQGIYIYIVIYIVIYIYVYIFCNRSKLFEFLNKRKKLESLFT